MGSKPIIRSLGELVEADVPPMDFVLEPWLPVNGLAMVAGATGLGKTMLAMAVAVCIAGGGTLLGWRAPEPRGVLYVDGEMALADMKKRAVDLLASAQGIDVELAKENLHFLCDNDQPDGLGKLGSDVGIRNMIERLMEEKGLEVLWLDNLSALCNSENENDVESWTVMQKWLLKLRRKGYTVIFLHHTGKVDMTTGTAFYKQRGTSKREDVLNTSIILVPAKTKEGKTLSNAFQIVFTKHRHFTKPDPLVVQMDFTNGTKLVTEWDKLGYKGNVDRLVESI